MEWNYIALIGEIVLDVIVLQLGVLLIYRAQDNRLRLFWGMLSLLLAGLMLYDNVTWLRIWPDEMPLVSDGRVRFMSLTRMMKFYLVAHAFSLFPLASLRPGWLTSVKLIILSFPLLVALVITLSYKWFNGYITPVDSLREVFQHLSRPDIQVRLMLFCFSVITPALYTFLPIVGLWKNGLRKINAGMALYVVLWMMIAVCYIFYTLTPSLFLFSIVGYVVMLLPVVFSLLFLRQENPLSVPPDPDRPREAETELAPVSPVVYRLSVKMAELMREECLFTRPEYTVEELARQLNARQNMVVDAIRYAGYTGFREYMIALRLEYFKHLAASCPGASVKEMMFRSGFTSRSSFYRQFTGQERISPKEYIDRLFKDGKS